LSPEDGNPAPIAANLVAQEYVRLLNEKEYTKIVHLFAEGAEFIGQGVCLSGRSALEDFYPRAINSLSPDRVSIQSSISEGNSCAIEIEAVYRDNGVETSRWASDVFTVDSEGRIIRLAVYVRSALKSVRPASNDGARNLELAE
jgi:hypothetical protein